ncbi:T9SS C-terminal target domain-containing protein [Flavobacteriaceae bacterium AU392]|nr:T9SS C-terminal target domain-containing protein [Flavobacteriaceae bacterium]RKM86590.1 T9SS C-terminal target domain-containing protein [Flavobacteriaceae bacterium AU392]
MKSINQILILFFILIYSSINAQITFNACNSLLENQDYTFNQISTDATGRNVFETNPVDGNQPCGGIGVCEFRIAWNDTESRWEIFADDGNGTFTDTFILYTNTEASSPNPPDLTLGTWIENTSVTQSLCGGISTLIGDVQGETLSTSDADFNNQIEIFPNPASQFITINGNRNQVDEIIFYDIHGRLIFSENYNNEALDISRLTPGLYFARFVSDERELVKKLIVQ